TEGESSTRKTRSGMAPASLAVPPGAGDSPAKRRGTNLLNEPIFDRVVREIGVGFCSHLVHDSCAVRAHRLIAEKQLIGNFPYRAARGQLAKHLELALAQLLMRWTVIASD